MAKAVVPMRAFREKYGELAGDDIGARLQAFVHEFLTHEPAAAEKDKKREATAGIKN